MKYAINRWSNKTLAAEEAPSGDSYRCPVCAAPVTLRAGGERSAYFAHKPGMGTKDCELYHLGATPTFSSLHQSSHNSIWEIELKIVLAKAGFPRGWGLELDVPFRQGCIGELDIDVGGRVQTVGLTNSGRNKRVTAEPQEKEYKVVSARLSDARCINTLVTKCAGLSATKATVFGEASHRDGSPIQRANTVRCGGRFVFVWNRTLSPEFYSELIVEHLDSYQSWSAAIVDIPEQVSEPCKSWIIDFCGLELYNQGPTFVPLWPPSVANHGAQLLQAPRSSTIYFYVTRTSIKQSQQSVIYARSGQEDVAISMSSNAPPFIRVSSQNVSSFQVSCRDIPELSMELDCIIDVSKIPQPAGVVLKGIASDGSNTATHLHDQDASIWLEQVRLGDIQLSGLEAPSFCHGNLRVGKGGNWNATPMLTVRSDDTKSKERRSWNDFVPIIINALADRTVDVKLDFGAFGRVWLAAKDEPIIKKKVLIDAKLRNRIFAYLGQMPKIPSPRPVSFNGPDEALVEAVLGSRPAQQAMATHRTLLAELSRLARKGSSK